MVLAATLLASALTTNIWTVNSSRFMYPPRLEFPQLRGAGDATMEVSGADGATNVLRASGCVFDLAPVWDALPVGYVHMTARAGDREARRFFWKKAMFREGAYDKAKCGYGECAAKCFRYLMDMPAIRHLVEKGEPDPRYALNCYPNKMCASIAAGFAHHAAKCPEDAARSLAIAKAAADWLISVSEKDGAPLAGFPPTYMGKNFTAKQYAGQIMLNYPCLAAKAYLALERATGEAKYLEAAKKIGERYLTLQGDDGTWPMKLYAKDGRPACPNRLFPIGMIETLEDLHAATGDARYRVSADKAFGYIERGPMVDWNWEGQFEDVKPSKKYANLTMHPVCSTAIYCLRRFPGNAQRIAEAMDAERFAEDQFIDWEVPYGVNDPPVWGPYAKKKWQNQFAGWHCPAVMEQYECYVPVDGSSAKLIRLYIALHKATGDGLYMKKARALGDQATVVQERNGLIPTWWGSKTPGNGNWINCMIGTSYALEELAEACGE